MKAMSEPVLFFGSGPVAAASLERLATCFTIEAVITKPKPAHHRGEFPVLTAAERLQLPVHTASNRAELSALFTPNAAPVKTTSPSSAIAARPFVSRLAVLIDFGIIVGQDVIDYFPLGIVNSHFSLLPEWRGADPITFAILSGQPRTGVSLMLLVQKMDEGPILAQGTFDLPPTITTPQLTSGLIDLSFDLLRQHLPAYLGGQLQPTDQLAYAQAHGLPTTPTYSRKLTKDDGQLDFSRPAAELERAVRAFIDWPKSHATLADKEVIITAAHVGPMLAGSPTPGSARVEAGQLVVACGNDSLVIDRLKPAGKNDMSAQAFLAGHNL